MKNLVPPTRILMLILLEGDCTLGICCLGSFPLLVDLNPWLGSLAVSISISNLEKTYFKSGEDIYFKAGEHIWIIQNPSSVPVCFFCGVCQVMSGINYPELVCILRKPVETMLSRVYTITIHNLYPAVWDLPDSTSRLSMIIQHDV